MEDTPRDIKARQKLERAFPMLWDEPRARKRKKAGRGATDGWRVTAMIYFQQRAMDKEFMSSNEAST